MKFRMDKERFFHFINVTILANIILIAPLFTIIPTLLETPLEFMDILTLSVYTFVIIAIDYLLFSKLPIICMTISFDADDIKCVSLKKIKQRIRYDELKEYGVFTPDAPGVSKKKFIYISRMEIPTILRKNSIISALNVEFEDIIVVRYQDKIMEVLKNKVPEIQDYCISD